MMMMMIIAPVSLLLYTNDNDKSGCCAQKSYTHRVTKISLTTHVIFKRIFRIKMKFFHLLSYTWQRLFSCLLLILFSTSFLLLLRYTRMLYTCNVQTTTTTKPEAGLCIGKTFVFLQNIQKTTKNRNYRKFRVS